MFLGLVASQGAVTLKMDRQVYAPSEKVTISLLDAGEVPDNAWLGIIPAAIPHGNVTENNRYDRQYRYVRQIVEGQLTFDPIPEGEWTARLNDSENELASVAFAVSKTHVPPGQKAPELTMDRTRLAPSEKPVIRFQAPTAYGSKAWVGLIPANIEHGREDLNNAHDVQYQYLKEMGRAHV